MTNNEISVTTNSVTTNDIAFDVATQYLGEREIT